MLGLIFRLFKLLIYRGSPSHGTQKMQVKLAWIHRQYINFFVDIRNEFGIIIVGYEGTIN